MPLSLSILSDNILPAFLVMAVGVILDRCLQIDKKTLSRTAVYVLTPCLVLSLIAQSSVDPRQFGRMALYAVAVTAVMVLLAMLVGRLLR